MIAGRRLLRPFEAAGRIPLTIYLFTSLLMMWFVFAPWGLDLFGVWGQAQMLAVSMVVIAAELVAANVWLKYYDNGPMEWLWKSLAYQRREPFRKSRSEPPDALPGEIRMRVHGAHASRLRRRIEQPRVSPLGMVAAKQRRTPAPSAAAGNPAGGLHHEIGAVFDQPGIHSHDLE